jgi:hypothetical protein
MTLDNKAEMDIGTVPDGRVLSALESDEQLLWSGRPGRGIIFHSSDILLLPLGLLSLAACFWGIGRMIREFANRPKGFPLWIDLFFFQL